MGVSTFPPIGVFKNSIRAGVAEQQRAVKRHGRMKAEELMTASKRLVPRDTGTLVGTGFVRGPSGTDRKWFIEVGFSANYAIYVHEIPPPSEGAPHPDQITPGTRTARHDPPTQWKFLQRPAESMFKKFEFTAASDAQLKSVLRRFF